MHVAASAATTTVEATATTAATAAVDSLWHCGNLSSWCGLIVAFLFVALLLLTFF